jgi:hypothetical protein
MERFGNSALQFSSSRQSIAKTDLSTIPSIEVPQCGTKLEASATVEADTCRKYVVPIRLGGGGSLFCGLKTLAFPACHLVHRSSATRNEVGSLSDGGSLPCRAGLSRQSGTETEAGRRRACRVIVKRRRKPFLSRRLVSPKSDLSRRGTAETDVGGSVTKTEALVSVLGKFGVSDQLPSPI